MSDLEPILFYFGMAITQDQANRIFCFGQQIYLEKIFQNHEMWDYKAVVVPIDRILTSLPKNYQATNTF